MQNEFLEAVKAGDAATVRRTLEENRELATACDANGISALMLATYYQKRDVADILLAEGIDLNIFEASARGALDRISELLDADPPLVGVAAPDGFFPLGLAVYFGHGDAVDLLLARGADVNAEACNAARVRPVHSAAAIRDHDMALAMAGKLLAHGAEVNVAQHGGWTPLHQAAAAGNIALIDLLLAHGADMNTLSDDGKTPLDMAVEREQREAVERLRALMAE